MILEHKDSLNTHTECKSAIFFRVNSAVTKHVGVNHTRTENLDPTLALAKTASLAATCEAGNVNLSRWLGKREVVGT